jgi:LCP family protein required for cell wall assembly
MYQYRFKGVRFMMQWIKYCIAFILLGSIALGGYLYWLLEPKGHFLRAEVPVLALPAIVYPSLEYPSLEYPTLIKNKSPNEKAVKAFNVLILGVDARGSENSRSDVMMVIRVIPEKLKVNIVSIPRDTRIEIKGVGLTKINHAHILGEMEGGNNSGTLSSVKAVSNLLDIPINYYMKTNFQGFENMINEFGGVDVQIEQDLLLKAVNQTLKKGVQHIDGKLALGLVRERWAFKDGDFGRQAEQAQILRNLALELLKPEKLSTLANVLTKVKKDILDTNFSNSDLISLAWLFKEMKVTDFNYIQLPGQSGYEMDPLVKSRLYYWIPNVDQLKALEANYLN